MTSPAMTSRASEMLTMWLAFQNRIIRSNAMIFFFIKKVNTQLAIMRFLPKTSGPCHSYHAVRDYDLQTGGTGKKLVQCVEFHFIPTLRTFAIQSLNIMRVRIQRSYISHKKDMTQQQQKAGSQLVWDVTYVDAVASSHVRISMIELSENAQIHNLSATMFCLLRWNSRVPEAYG